ncbi:MAG TPA: hypothetical protein VKO18_10370 [Terriglobia bacterium]|nr:hypothetical protein [Terriglobia bacterium]
MSRILRICFICFLDPRGSGDVEIPIMNVLESWYANSPRLAACEVGAAAW